MPTNPYEPPREKMRRTSHWWLPAKMNPDATPSSVARWALAGALSAVGFYAYMVFARGLPSDFWPLAIAFAVVAGALVGALIEWQIDWEIDE